MAQALNRQTTAEADTDATLSALGVSGRQLTIYTMARTLLLAVVGTMVGVVLAAVLFPLTVVGEVRLADPSTGFTFDTPVLLLGGLTAVIVVLALGLWPALRAARMHVTPATGAGGTPVSNRHVLERCGRPAQRADRVRHALERGRGRTPSPWARRSWARSLLSPPCARRRSSAPASPT